MVEFYFFEIPIYRCSMDAFIKEVEEEKNKFMTFVENSGVPREKAPESYQNAENLFYDTRCYPWEFNEIVGWIRLYVLGDQLRGELWWIDSKKITRHIKKDIKFSGKAFELWIEQDADSKTIYNQLCKQLESISKEPLFKNRYVNLEMFKNIGPFINWRDLMGFDKKQVSKAEG